MRISYANDWQLPGDDAAGRALHANRSLRRPFFENTVMNTAPKRGTSPATPRRSRSAPELAWLYAAAGLGIADGIVLAADFALTRRVPEGESPAGRAAMPVLAAAAPVPGPGSDPQPIALVPQAPPTVDKEPASPAPAAVPDPEPKAPPVPPAEDATFRERLRGTHSEDDLRRQLYRVPEFGLKPAVRDALVESYKMSYQSNAALSHKPLFDPSILLSRLPGARQLPLRGFPVCQLTPDSAATLGVLSRAYMRIWTASRRRTRTGIAATRGRCERPSGWSGAASRPRGCGLKHCRRWCRSSRPRTCHCG